MAKKKELKVEIKEDKKSYEVLHEGNKREINRLIEFHKVDKVKARVIYHQDKSKYYYERVVMFNDGDNFSIVRFIVRYGISISNKIYYKQSRVSSIIYKNKKFYQTSQYKLIPKFTQLNYHGINNFAGQELNGLVKSILISKFSWIRWVYENEDIYGFCFNTIIRYNLMSYHDVLRHMYGVPINICRILMNNTNNYNTHDLLMLWKEMKKVLINVQNLTPELYKSPLFIDTCKMAGSLDKKVNCSWGLNRLKEEHDTWSKEITKTILEYSVLQKLNVAKEYRAFGKFSGYQLLKTNKDLIREGQTQRHCVATYIDSVDSGSCGIYHVEGYTLQIQKPYRYKIPQSRLVNGELVRDVPPKPENEPLVINQFKGLNNNEAPLEIRTKVQQKLDEFNLLSNFEKYLIDIEEPELGIDIEGLEIKSIGYGMPF